MKKEKVLVTSGAGFIGWNIVHYQDNKYLQYDIFNMDLLTYAGELTKHSDMVKKKTIILLK